MSSMDAMLTMTQHQANSRPTTADIKATRRILKDFGIRNIKIPDCKTVAELMHLMLFTNPEVLQTEQYKRWEEIVCTEKTIPDDLQPDPPSDVFHETLFSRKQKKDETDGK